MVIIQGLLIQRGKRVVCLELWPTRTLIIPHHIAKCCQQNPCHFDGLHERPLRMAHSLGPGKRSELQYLPCSWSVAIRARRTGYLDSHLRCRNKLLCIFARVCEAEPLPSQDASPSGTPSGTRRPPDGTRQDGHQADWSTGAAEQLGAVLRSLPKYRD